MSGCLTVQRPNEPRSHGGRPDVFVFRLFASFAFCGYLVRSLDGSFVE
jgi:hypothetical protein